MTDRFLDTARLMAAACGLPDYPFAVVPHPISSDADAALRAKAEDAVAQCAEIFFTPRRVRPGSARSGDAESP